MIKGSKVDVNGAPPKAPASPAAAESAEDPKLESTKDLEKATVSAALKEKQKIKTKGGKPEDKIEFSDLK